MKNSISGIDIARKMVYNDRISICSGGAGVEKGF